MSSRTDFSIRKNTCQLSLSDLEDHLTIAEVEVQVAICTPWSPGKPVQVRRCPATVNGDETCEKPLVVRLGRCRE
jgi:hypothetical protein